MRRISLVIVLCAPFVTNAVAADQPDKSDPSLATVNEPLRRARSQVIATYFWNGGATGSLNDDLNWFPAIVPTELEGAGFDGVASASLDAGFTDLHFGLLLVRNSNLTFDLTMNELTVGYTPDLSCEAVDIDNNTTLNLENGRFTNLSTTDMLFGSLTLDNVEFASADGRLVANAIAAQSSEISDGAAFFMPGIDVTGDATFSDTHLVVQDLNVGGALDISGLQPLEVSGLTGGSIRIDGPDLPNGGIIQSASTLDILNSPAFFATNLTAQTDLTIDSSFVFGGTSIDAFGDATITNSIVNDVITLNMWSSESTLRLDSASILVANRVEAAPASFLTTIDIDGGSTLEILDYLNVAIVDVAGANSLLRFPPFPATFSQVTSMSVRNGATVEFGDFGNGAFNSVVDLLVDNASIDAPYLNVAADLLVNSGSVVAQNCEVSFLVLDAGSFTSSSGFLFNIDLVNNSDVTAVFEIFDVHGFFSLALSIDVGTGSRAVLQNGVVSSDIHFDTMVNVPYNFGIGNAQMPEGLFLQSPVVLADAAEIATNGVFAQGDEGELEVEQGLVGGASIQAAAPSQVGGTLRFSIPPAVDPSLLVDGDRFDIVSAPDITGQFAVVELPGLDNSRILSPLIVQDQFDPLRKSLSVVVGTLSDTDIDFGGASDTAIGSVPTAVDTAQFDSDGALDIVVTVPNTGGGGQGAVQRLLRDPSTPDGAPGFLEGTQLAVGVDPSDVVPALIDNDAHLDLVVSNRGDDNLTIYRGDGAGGYLAAVTVPNVGDGPSNIAVADFDGDADLDLAVTNEIANNVQVLLNDGFGSFTLGETLIDDTGRRPKSVKPKQFDPEPARSSSAMDLVVVWEGTPVGSTTTGTPPSPGLVSVYHNSGAATFDPPITIEVGYGAVDVDTGDFDGDGLADIVVASAGGLDEKDAGPGDDVVIPGNIAILLNDSAAPDALAFSPPAFLDPGDAKSVAAVDWDEDGRTDIAVVVDSPGVARVLRNATDGGSASRAIFRSPVDILGATDAAIVTAGDLDNDGDEDLIIVGAQAGARSTIGEVTAHPNNAFQPPDIDGDGIVDGADLAALLAAWGSIGSAADLNGDGNVDGADLAQLLAAWGT